MARAAAAPALLLVILLVAAVLRLDALGASFGPHWQPRWLGAAEATAARLSSIVTPEGWGWHRDPNPYRGGDPGNYIRFARQMRHFYQAHVREPVFLVATRVGLWLAGGADVGISITSITFSLLVIVAVYLLGREVVSTWAGLLAAAILAIDWNVIFWSLYGWRSETFAFFALLAAWLWLRSTRVPSTQAAVWAGIATGLATLTRLTAPFLLLPAVLWTLAVPENTVRRQRLRTALIGGSVAAVIVAPYLISCAVVFGDPFYAVNYHTQFYLARAGETPEIINAGSYVLGRFTDRPLEAVDIGIQGLTTFPFSNKWDGLDTWWPGLGLGLAWVSAAGLLAWLFVPRGRFMLVVLAGSLAPYMLTWPIPGGAEYRFTFHAYVFYLLAAFGLLTSLVRFRIRACLDPSWRRRAALRGSVAAAVVLAGLVWWWAMPPLVAAEGLVHGDAVVVSAGPRDRWQLRPGWSRLSVTGNVTARFGTAPISDVQLPRLERRDYQLVLRVDPIPRGDLPEQRLRVWFNRHPLGVVELAWDPAMVGRYEMVVPARLIDAGHNVLRLQPDALVDAGPVTGLYPALRTGDRVGFRFWYVLITPQR